MRSSALFFISIFDRVRNASWIRRCCRWPLSLFLFIDSLCLAARYGKPSVNAIVGPNETRPTEKKKRTKERKRKRDRKRKKERERESRECQNNNKKKAQTPFLISHTLSADAFAFTFDCTRRGREQRCSFTFFLWKKTQWNTQFNHSDKKVQWKSSLTY